jgi:hypothetical protein
MIFLLIVVTMGVGRRRQQPRTPSDKLHLADLGERGHADLRAVRSLDV